MSVTQEEPDMNNTMIEIWQSTNALLSARCLSTVMVHSTS